MLKPNGSGGDPDGSGQGRGAVSVGEVVLRSRRGRVTYSPFRVGYAPFRELVSRTPSPCRATVEEGEEAKIINCIYELNSLYC